MTTEEFPCSVCGTSFRPELAYQVEERKVTDADGSRHSELTYYCSLDCVSQSHESSGRAQCDVCGRTFTVELVSQVINHRGRRHHACSGSCRQQILDRLNGPTFRPAVPVALGAPTMATPMPSPAAPTPVHATAASIAAAASTSPSPRSNLNASTTPPLPGSSTNAAPTTGPAPAPTATLVPMTPNVVPNAASRVVPLRPAPSTAAKSTQLAHDPNADDVNWRRIEASLDGRTQVLAVFNHKGGTGKTTTAVTVAAGLAAKGRRVLLVDTDGQGNVGVSLGMQNEKTLYHVLVMGLDPREAIVEVRPNLHVLPSNETLAAAELFLAGRQRRDRVLASRLGVLRAEYDAIIVDCSPSLSLMNQNALVFADGVLCPVACDYLSLVGVRQVLRTIKQVNRLLSHPVRLWGVLPTLYDARARVCVEAYDTLRQHFGDRCLAPIRMASRAKEAPSQSQTLFEYAPDATATKDYWQVVEQLLDECENRNGEAMSAAGGAK